MIKKYPSIANSYLIAFFFFVSLFSFGQISQPFPSSNSFTVPAGVTSITVQAWGGGGAGGGSNNAIGLTARGGAGGGAYATANITVTPGDNLAVVVGGGGTGVPAGTGSTGGFSTIAGFETIIYAAGGAGGTRNTTGGTPIGGAGGAVAASVGTTRIAGGSGGNGNTGFVGILKNCSKGDLINKIPAFNRIEAHHWEVYFEI